MPYGMGSVGGSAASGLQAGFSMGMQATQAEEQRKQREFENARQTAADTQRADQLARANARQDKLDTQSEDDRALAGVNTSLEDARYQLGALHAQYGDQPIPDSEAKPLYTAVGQHFATKQALLAKRYQPVIDATTQKWKDFASKAETGQVDPNALRGQDLRDFIKATTGHDLSEYANGTVGNAINDATTGLSTKNGGMTVRAAGTLLGPQIKQGLGAIARDGSQIVDKDLAALVPAPQQAAPGAAQGPNPIQGLTAALSAATNPVSAGNVPPMGEAGLPKPAVAGGPPQALTPGTDPGAVLPVLQVTTRQPDGRLTTYHAPVTKGRGTGDDEGLAQPLQVSDLMDRMGRLGVVDNWLKTPEMAAAVQDALKGSPTTFEQAWGMVHGDPKALLAAGQTDPTSVKIQAIQKLAKDQGISFAEASSQLAGHEGPAKRGLAGAAPAASAAAVGTGLPGAQVAPAEQASRDAEAIKVIQRERDAAATRLASGDKSAQADIDAFDKEIAKLKTPAAAPATGVNVALTKGIKGLTPQQNDALFGKNGAVTQGRVDMGKINSRTAPIYADAEMTNPGQDFAKMSGDIQLGRNATFRQRAMIAETLPEIMQNMVDSGKKLDFSNLQPVGQMQLWVKGKTNDPALTEYMTQRNDALMTIAGVMRGVGMTDQAHKAEIEVSAPTMSPQALDAWMSGQMKSLAPRLKLNRGIVKNLPVDAAPGGAAPAGVQTATNPKTGEKLMLQGGQWVPFK